METKAVPLAPPEDLATERRRAAVESAIGGPQERLTNLHDSRNPVTKEIKEVRK
jgi:hypothetical protein